MKLSTLNGKLKLLAVGTNAKTVKGDGSKYLTAIMYLAPADTVEKINVCSMAALAKCKEPCLYTSGHGARNNTQKARIRKTAFYRDDRDAFKAQLARDMVLLLAYGKQENVTICVRLNGTSDVLWEHEIIDDTGLSIVDTFPTIQFYDYSKMPTRKTPANYHLTWSYSGANIAYSSLKSKARKHKRNIAVVVRSKALAARIIGNTYEGMLAIDGDANDLRFTDGMDKLVILYAKGKAVKDDSGFVIDDMEAHFSLDQSIAA